MNLFLAPVTRALGRQITQTHVWVNPYLVNRKHRLEHIDGALLGGEVGECVAVFGGGGHQARSVLKEELDKVGVVVLCGEMDRLLVQVVVGVDGCLKKSLLISYRLLLGMAMRFRLMLIHLDMRMYSLCALNFPIGMNGN